MSSIVVSGDVSGAVTLSAPATAGTVTVTLPSTSGTMAVGGGTITTITTTSDITVQGVTVGEGGGSIATNTVVGASALASGSQTGINNTAIGQTALTSNTSGNENSALGRQALYSNTTGGSNSGLGMNTLVDNTTGSYNTAVGRSALQSNTTASNNTAVGYQAGYAYTGTTGYNTFFGWQAGTAVTSGSVNTYIGPGAGNLMTSGAKNTILGAFNGNSFGLDIRTASNNIVLSDGDGNPRGVFDSYGGLAFGGATTANNNSASFRAVQIKNNTATTILSSDYSSQLASNGYWDGGAWQRGGNSYAPVLYNQFNGAHTFSNAAAAGTAITWVDRMILNSEGQAQFVTDHGIAQISNTYSLSVGAGGTVDFPNFSGMIIVNNYSLGGVGVWIVGGGSVTVVATVATASGSVAYRAAVGGWRWTENSGATNTYSFTAIRTRPTA